MRLPSSIVMIASDAVSASVRNRFSLFTQDLEALIPGTGERERAQRGDRRGNCEEPAAPPDRRQDLERHCGRRLAFNTVGRDRTYEKPVRTRREVCKVDIPSGGWQTPIRCGAFQLVLVAERLARSEADCKEI